MESPANENQKKAWLTTRQKRWIEAAYLAAIVTLVVAAHFATVGKNQGYLFGTAETTIAAAVAFGLITPLIAFRIIEFSKKLSGNRAVVAVMVATTVLLSGGIPLQLMSFQLEKQLAVMDAHFRGYGAATTVARLAEKQPQDVRQIGVLVGSEILHESFKLSVPEQRLKDMEAKIAEGWKKIGFEKSPLGRSEDR
jgi:hypothetical protein